MRKCIKLNIILHIEGAKMDYCDIGSAKLAYKLYGSGKTTLVVETCLGGSSSEWWHIAEGLSSEYRVLLYDRAGIGESSVSTLDRTAKNIASELDKLLNSLKIEDCVVIGHSQGGMYAMEYACLHQDKVKGIILLDPALTPFDDIYREKLTAKEAKKFYIGDAGRYKLAILLSTLGLYRFLIPMIKNEPPLASYEYPEETVEYMLKAICDKKTLKTVLKEYTSNHTDKYTKEIEDRFKKSVLQNMPLKLVTHSKDVMVKYIMTHKVDEKLAIKYEDVSEQLNKKYLSLSNNSEHIIAQTANHFIHLTDYNAFKTALDGIKAAIG